MVLGTEIVDGDGALRRAVTAPGASVEIAQHQAAPVALHRRRQRAIEAHPECRLVGFHEPGNVGRAHLLTEPGHGRVGIRQGPESARQSRKEEKQQDRERQRVEQLPG